jgi:Hemolysin coregulated protein Hcp (TssD)
MSSFNATLQAEGGEFEVLSCSYSFGQATDERGRPASNVQSGSICVKLTTSEDTSLLGWMIDPHKKISGSIVFKKVDEDATLKEVKFEDAYCVGYSEAFSSTSATAMTVSLNISARKIEIGDVNHENHAA